VERSILDTNMLRYGILALIVAGTLGLAALQLVKRQRVSDIADWWLHVWSGGGIALVALEALE
jgi:hypothetical protein